LEGVIRTRVGYAGGEKENPSYNNMGDHTEAVQVDFDPQRISFPELLAIFWERHRPGQRAWSRQYMNAVFYLDEIQKQRAMKSKTEVEEKLGRPVRTQILPLRSFTLAEDYHQKYLLNRQSELARELIRIYPIRSDFINSTAVARLNGYVGGYGQLDQLNQELPLLGLSPTGRELLVELVR
jgi:methionine-S-sulfoxide reductase